MVANGAFAVEITHNTTLILEKINVFFGYNAVSKIKIIQNESSFYETDNKFNEYKEDKKLVSPEQQNYIKQITENIKNPDLKERLRSLGENIFKQNN